MTPSATDVDVHVSKQANCIVTLSRLCNEMTWVSTSCARQLIRNYSVTVECSDADVHVIRTGTQT